ncbi:AT-hook motif nuclear-localized protein 27-like [Brachypodium distachyon]|uniref:AT-hook motif nuclear-localized protein 27-like n=1 Tax=Brachypodium distachyon TaxID=15368 RepID=UPI000234E348|nr:AT-hook motif nuclear-localized protein 27-like [Brachypodium distachyon]|eukprot:XP_003567487.1 AT-hook motif nuclear-localized protein 27-like [Brachypodium distachyon]
MEPAANERLEPEPPFALVPQPAPVAEQKPRARGRPPGSRNKPKPPVIVTRESAAAMRPVVLELAPGCDVAGAVAAFARRRGLGVSVLCGRGAVCAIALRLASAAPEAAGNGHVVRLQGRLEVLTMSGTVLPSSSSSSAPAAPPPPFVVTFAGENGRVIGGTLAGEMTAAEDGVVVVAATFKDPETHRLPAAPETETTKVEVEGDDGSVGVLGRFQDERHLLVPPQQQQQPATVAAPAGMWHGGFGGLPGQVGHYPQHAAEQMHLRGQMSDPGTPNHPSWTHYL